jgi:hypothetical protein
MKEGEEQPVTQRISADELKSQLDQAYFEFQNQTGKLKLPFGESFKSLFGNRDLSIEDGSSLPLEEEMKRDEGSEMAEKEKGTMNVWPNERDFFMEEMMKMEREMDLMRRRMDEEMRRFFAF